MPSTFIIISTLLILLSAILIAGSVNIIGCEQGRWSCIFCKFWENQKQRRAKKR